MLSFQLQLYKKTPAALSSLDASQTPEPNVAGIINSLSEQKNDIGAHNCVGLSCVIPNGDSSVSNMWVLCDFISACLKLANGPYAKLLHSNLKGLGVPIFQAKNANNSVQISSPQLLHSKRYSRLKLPFDFLWGILYPRGDSWVSPIGNLLYNCSFNLEYLLLRSNCGLAIWTLL